MQTELVGIGVETVDVEQLTEAVHENGLRYIDELFTPAERRFCWSRPRSMEAFAAHLAAKEALLKAHPELRVGDVHWSDIEVKHDDKGAPRVTLGGTVLANYRRIGLGKIHLSIAQAMDNAVAFVVLH